MKEFKIKKILVPVDFSETSLKAADYAVELSVLSSAKIVLLHVVENIVATSDPSYFTMSNVNVEKELRELSSKNLEQLAEKLRKKIKTDIETITGWGRTHVEITDLAKKINVDMIVMGMHGVSGPMEFMSGSNTYRVVHDAQCPVLSIPQYLNDGKFKNILVPFRDKSHSREKVDYAIALAKLYQATLHILGVDTAFDKEHLQRIQREADQIKEIASHAGVKSQATVIQERYLADFVLHYATKINADLIVAMADMDRVSVREIFMGPYVHQIINQSKIPVFTIRPTFNTDTVDLRFY